MQSHPNAFARLWTGALAAALLLPLAALHAESLDDALARKARLEGISPAQAMNMYMEGQEWMGEALSPDMARYLWLKERDLPIPAALLARLFPPARTRDASERQGGDTAATATPIGALPYSDTGTTAGYVNDVPNTAYTNIGLTCAWSGFYSSTQSGNSLDVFYSLELAQEAVITVSLCGSSYDSALGLFNNVDGALGTLVSGNDDGCGLQSQIVACAVPAGSYFIVVDGYGTSNGAYTLNVQEVADPCEAYTDAITAATAPATVTGSNVGRSSVWGGTGGDLGFDITLPEDGLWNFDACFAGTSVAVDLYLFTDSPCDGGTLITSSNTSTCAVPTGAGRMLELNLTAGTYHLLVGNDGTVEGACEVHVLHPPGRPTQGGPDIMGYAWANSFDAEGPDYAWVEIQGTGTNLNIEGDDQQGSFTLPWPFPFYESSYTAGLASSNGYISFGTTATLYTNTALPTTATPNNGIYAFWDDLTTGTSADAASVWSWHDTANDRFIIEWYQVPQLGGPTQLNTFQVILYPDGRSLVQYQDMAEGDIAGASTGTENSTGTIGLQVNFNGEGGLLADQMAIAFTPMEGDFTPPLIAHTPLQSVETELQGGYQVNATITDESGVAAARLVYAVNGGAPVTVPLTAAGNVWSGLLPHQEMGSTVAYHLEADDQTEDGNTAVSATWTFSVVSYLWPPQNLQATDGSLLMTNLTWLAPVNPGLLAERLGMPLPRDRDEGVERFMAQGLSKEQALSEWEGLFAESSRAFIQYQVYRNGELAGTTTSLSFTDNLAHGAQNEVVYTYTVRALFTAGESDPSNSDTGYWTQGQTSGGPDGYGYVWYNSSHEEGPAYNWIDISQSGTALTLSDDSFQGPLDLGFTFPFYLEDETQVFVGSNGFLSFGTGSSSLSNMTLPSTGTPNNLIAGFWDDLYPTTAPAAVKYLSDVANGRFIVSWLQVPHCCNSTGPAETFQIILYNDGRIVVQFNTMNGNLTSSTTGIENADGTIGLQYQYNGVGAPVANQVAILFVPPVGPEITHTPLVDVETEVPGTHNVVAEITSEIGVASATVFYTVNGGQEQSVPMSLQGGNTWMGAIPHQAAGSTVVYHIEATDTQDNTRSSMVWDFALVSYHWPPVGLSATDGNFNTTTITWQPPVNPGLLAHWFGDATPHNTDEAVERLMAQGLDKAQAYATWNGLFEQAERVFVEYKLYRDGQLLATTTALTFTDSFSQGSQADVTYTYTVTAQFTAGESTPSAGDTGYWAGTPTFGGPDAFGYTWRNSVDPVGPDYEWTDISATGTVLILSDDSFQGPIELGFTFPFYTEFETQIYIGSNGFLTFGTGSGNLSNQNLPNTTLPNNLIATFWDDMNPGSSSSGDVYYLADAENGRFIVQFQDIVAYAGTVPFTFQTILDASGSITMMYEDVNEADLSQCTIGIENADASIGLTALFDGTGANIGDQMAYVFLPPSSCEPVECAGIAEQEPNEGWNDNNASWNSIQCDQTRCGTILAAPGETDTDWYLYTHFGGDITVTLDVSDFNGRLTLREQAVGGQIVAEANSLPRCFDEAFSVSNLTGGAYYIVVEHTGDADVLEPATYALSVECSGDPCSGHQPIECVGTGEVEPNEGWNASPPNSSYGTILRGQTICGSTWANAGQRDMDWYHFTQTSTDTVSFTCLIDAFDAALFLTDFNPAGSILAEVNNAPACAPETLVYPNLPAGEYFIAIGHSSFDGVPEAQNYALAFGSVAQPEDPCDNYVDVGNFHDIYTVVRPAPSRVHHSGTGCPGGISSPGLDEVTRLVLSQVTDLQVTLTGEGMADEVILLLGNCAQPSSSCGAARDVNGADAGGEVLTIANVPAGDYFLVADFAGEGETHPYVMTIIDMESGQDGIQPIAFNLDEAHPNPFNPTTTLAWTQPKLATASLRVHDLRGALVEELDLGLRGAGRHEVVWDATRFSSGVYFLTLQAGEDAATRKAVLMK